MDNISSQPNKKVTSDRQFWLFGMRIIGDFGATIAVPVVGFALGGKWLDKKFGTAPWFLVAGFALAAVISGFMIWKKAKRIGKEYQHMIEADMRGKQRGKNADQRPSA